MSKPLLIGAVIVILVIIGIVVWNRPSTEPTSSPSPTAEETTGEPATEVPPESLPQVGVDDIAAEAESTATLDTTIDSDIQQLDAELRGL